MCGIAGYFSTSAREDLSPALQRMTAAIAHRGPDDVGYFESATSDGRARVGLGHRRLSIIDLSTGHQPLGNTDGAVQIVFNGEIYNFEALRAELSACGHASAPARTRKWWCMRMNSGGPIACRDCAACLRSRSGTRVAIACFWHATGSARSRCSLYSHHGTLLFASEIKALLQFPGVVPRVNHAVLWDYFRYRYVPAPATLFADVHKLMPGSWMLCDADGASESRFYVPPDGACLDRTPQYADPVGRFLEFSRNRFASG